MKVFIEASREGYEPEQVYETLTLGELAETFTVMADELGEDTEVFLRHDNGYTYGGITHEGIEVEED